ncbi:MAG: hypothetical protein FWE86_00460, partial [Oscillospiraceae bacterium]|nr:hypothetical protein [Oscillospiraceae bacterium]
MKKTALTLVLILILCLFAACITYIIRTQACYHVFLRTDPPPGERTGDYNSVEEMIDDLLNGFDEDRLQEIEWEEDIPGTFKAFREDLIEKNELMVPMYVGAEMYLYNYGKDFTITLYFFDSFSRPWICYRGLMGKYDVAVSTMYIDDELVDEANEKGANWLINTIKAGTNSPEYPTLETYKKEKFIKAMYEVDLQLDGLSRTALVREEINKYDSRIRVYFVWENIFVD